MIEGFDLVIENARLEEDQGLKSIWIKDGFIKSVSPPEKKNAARCRIDACGKLVLPGFVNSHTHLDKVDLLRELEREGRRFDEGFDLSLDDQRTLMRRYKERYTVEGIVDRAERVVREMIRNGVTHIRTQVDVDHVVGSKAVEAVKELRRRLKGMVDIEISAFPQEGFFAHEASLRIFEEAIAKEEDVVVGGLPVKDGPRWREQVDRAFELAANYGRDLDMQLDESNDPGDFTLDYFVERAKRARDAGYRGGIAATHCISLSKQPRKTIERIAGEMAELNISMIVTPSCNLITSFDKFNKALEGGEVKPSTFSCFNSLAPVRALLAHNREDGRRRVNVALGTDNIRDIFYPFGNGSMIREMHLLANACRMRTEGDVAEILRMATFNGAGLVLKGKGYDEYGIGEGKRADLIVAGAETGRGVLCSFDFVPFVIKGGRVVSETKMDLVGCDKRA